MIYSEQQYKILEQQLQKMKKENELKDKEIKNLKKQNKNQQEVIHDLDRNDYRGQCETLKLENEELKKKLKIYEEKFEISRINLGKDSSNSCKPSSTNGFKKVVQNNRVKSNRKPGREKGHKRSAPTVTTTPDEVIKVSKVATCSCGCKTVEKEEVSRDLISLEVIVHTTQYTGKKTVCPCCNKEYQPKFPNNVKSIINYDEDIKSLIVYLNSYCNVPNQKTTEILGLLSNGKIKVCQGTVGSTMAQFSKKSKLTLQKMKREILKEPVINEDETPITVNGKIMSTIGVFTNRISIVEAFENRKLESFKEMGILDRYIGTVCHDHNSIHKLFLQSKQAECNFHILRYCKAEYEIHKWESIKSFMNYLLELRDKVDNLKLLGRTAFSEVEYEQAKKEYLKLLDAWDKEFLDKADKDKVQYYQSVKALKARLREYVDDHLRFLTDFRIDFTNNLAERGLRKIKTKLKIAGGFRNLKFAGFYCDAISIIDTCKKQNINIFETIKNIFIGKKKIFNFAY
ncbi:IS66 family transposase [Faecalibacillus intestinalis]|uniref:IS66 family transposase n=1 Tax=Faecalibacillus intestinalis TaxID=1982626 RepID=UPI00399AB9FE